MGLTMEQSLRGIWIVIFLGMVLAECIGTISDYSVKDANESRTDIPPIAAVRAGEVLRAELGVINAQVVIVSHVQKTWSDSCLGLGGIAESCLRTEVRGWLIEFSVKGETIMARTDELGEQVRFEGE
jgi:hypothetical protein